MTVKRILTAPAHQLLSLVILLTNLTAGNALAETIDIKGNAPQSYTVTKGDTLWDIASKYLEKPWRWPELWRKNPGIENPHLIYPGDIISLSYIDGQPQLGINRANSTIKLSPKIRSTPIDNAIPVIPAEAIQQFMYKHKVFDKTTIEQAAYIIHGPNERIISARGDRIYAKGLIDSDNKHYRIYRIDGPINDPTKDKVIGYKGIFVGDARLDHIGNHAVLSITSSVREVHVGDRVFAREKVDPTPADIYPKVPNSPLVGQILEIIDGTKFVGQLQTVIVNLGTADGLSRGHMLSVFNKKKTISGKTSSEHGNITSLPSEKSGTLMVMKTFKHYSYALVMESHSLLRIFDEIRSPSDE